MRLSRRSRYDAVPPNNVTYAHAINVCQKADNPDLNGAELFLRWAEADGIKLNVFMYSSAIWTAQRCGNWRKALEYFQEMERSSCDANSVAYNGVLSAFCSSGDTSKVMALYRDMKHAGHQLSGGTAKVRSWIPIEQPCQARVSRKF
jgi:pentatricopeptide repeat protein